MYVFPSQVAIFYQWWPLSFFLVEKFKWYLFSPDPGKYMLPSAFELQCLETENTWGSTSFHIKIVPARYKETNYWGIFNCCGTEFVSKISPFVRVNCICPNWQFSKLKSQSDKEWCFQLVKKGITSPHRCYDTFIHSLFLHCWWIKDPLTAPWDWFQNATVCYSRSTFLMKFYLSFSQTWISPVN